MASSFFSIYTLIFFFNDYLFTLFHKQLLFNAAYTIAPLPPFLTTGNIYLKSPQHKIGIPPINFLFPLTSYNELFTASNANLSNMEASSIIIA